MLSTCLIMLIYLFQVCSSNPKIINLDVERCASLDHVGRPIGEYGMFTLLLTDLDLSSLVLHVHGLYLQMSQITTYSV